MRFATGDLTSKWGFGDGDMLRDWWWDQVDAERLPEEPGGRDLLVEVVEQLVIPAVSNRLTTFRIASSHNPIRTDSVDGVEVDDSDMSTEVTLTPEYVEISDDQLLEVADRMIASR